MELTFFKFGTVIKRFEINNFLFSKKVYFPNRKLDNERKRDFRGGFSNF